jgi:hypothetical protein
MFLNPHCLTGRRSRQHLKKRSQVSITIFAARLLHKGLDVSRMEQTQNGFRMSNQAGSFD